MSSTERNAPTTMLGRVDQVLVAFQDLGPDLTASEVCRATGLPKATVSRIVAELIERNYLESSGRSLRLGIRLFELGVLAAGPRDIARLAAQHAKHLRAVTGQTIHLAVLHGTEVVYVQILRSKTAPALPSRVGGRLPAHATGVGKALLSRLTEDEIEDIFPETLASVTAKTITSRTRLLAQLKTIRQAGIAYEERESSPDLACVAAPIVGVDDRAIAAISITVHIGSETLELLGPAVATTAKAISAGAKRFNIHKYMSV